MQWAEAYKLWEQDMKASRMSRETLRTWRSYLRRWGRWCTGNDMDPMQATHREVKAWLAEHEHWSAASHKSARLALKSFYRLMISEGLIRAKRDPMAKVSHVRSRPGVPRPATEEQVLAGLRVWDADTRLMNALASECGLRRTEIAKVHSRDLHDNGIVVHGKGDRQRWVPVTDPKVWRDLGSRSGYVFPGRFTGHVHPQTVANRIKASAGTSPHPLRHRYASTVYDLSGDIVALQQLLGHQSLSTTQVYVEISRKRLVAAATTAVVAGWAAA